MMCWLLTGQHQWSRWNGLPGYLTSNKAMKAMSNVEITADVLQCAAMWNSVRPCVTKPNVQAQYRRYCCQKY